LGYFSQTVSDAVTGAELVLLESNHDPELLRQNPHYPYRLKNRILGKSGHLSNESGASAAVHLAQNGAKHLLLGHLSSENNTPALAYRTTKDALQEAGMELDRDVTLHVAARYQASYLYTIA
ncbi:MAG: MBL fold metallo-hydrolase, partial [Clostridia bacterium]